MADIALCPKVHERDTWQCLFNCDMEVKEKEWHTSHRIPNNCSLTSISSTSTPSVVIVRSGTASCSNEADQAQ
jgi:hypothetical protein